MHQSIPYYYRAHGLPRSAKTSRDICKRALFTDKTCIDLSWLCCSPSIGCWHYFQKLWLWASKTSFKSNNINMTLEHPLPWNDHKASKTNFSPLDFALKHGAGRNCEIVLSIYFSCRSCGKFHSVIASWENVIFFFEKLLPDCSWDLLCHSHPFLLDTYEIADQSPHHHHHHHLSWNHNHLYNHVLTILSRSGKKKNPSMYRRPSELGMATTPMEVKFWLFKTRNEIESFTILRK